MFNKLTTFLIDTGAEISIIKLESLRNHVNIWPNMAIAVNGIINNSNTVHTLGVCEADILINDIIFHHLFHVVRGDSIDLAQDAIIGADFLEKCKALIDFDTKSIAFPQVNELGLHTNKINHASILENIEKQLPDSNIIDKSIYNKDIIRIRLAKWLNHKYDKNLYRGMHNPNTMCYANSLFQAIFLQMNLANEIKAEDGCMCLGCILKNTSMKNIEDIASINPTVFHKLIHSVKPQWTNKQQDPHAFFLFCIDTLKNSSLICKNSIIFTGHGCNYQVYVIT